MPDRMHDTLDALRVDVDRVGLPDSGAVRRRGDRRTRNQAVAGALAVVALVAGAAGIFGAIDGDRRATQVPATPTPTVTQESIATQPFLPVDELTGLGGYDQAGPFIDAGQEPDLLPGQCATRPDRWGASQVRSTRYYQDGSEAEVREYVLMFDDPASARQASLKMAYADLVASCPTTVDPSEGALTTRYSELVPGFDQSVRNSRYFVPEVASEPNYYEVATVHRANVVLVLEWQASANPAGTGAQDWVWTTERLQTALDHGVS